MTPKLADAVRALASTPMDDCVCEGPHAAAKRIKMPASAAKWTWVASSMRLRQKLADCRALPQMSGVPLRAAWNGYSTIVQPSSKSTRVPRLTRSAFERRMYRLDHLLDFRIGDEARLAAVADQEVADLAAIQGGGSDSDGDIFGGDTELLEDIPEEAKARIFL